jgi:hypothetical protein
MRAFTIIPVVAALCGCKSDKPEEAAPRVHTVELTSPYEVVQVSVAGRDDLQISVFERDGRLVAAIIDQRPVLDRVEQIQRWEMLAKSNEEVAITTRKDFHWLKYAGATDQRQEDVKDPEKGSVLVSDTNGDGIPDYRWSPRGQFKISAIGYEEAKTSVTSFDIHELPSVTPKETYPAPSSQ